ncbi:YfiR family protein [Marinobacter arenosus]|uniref:YfiR family protein n=1 Tax=Marinobacter arenosus TaxID=2856822 RepID=UPI001C4CAD8E|nr:YfiR family protein [Marinobacter arenosus]MBW0147877.1 YfiR family protein [Marinobacter arenosus]
MKFLIALLLCALVGASNASVRSEYEVKAAFLYNFTRFITWTEPQADGSDLEICVLGQDPFGDLLEQLDGRVSQGRTLGLAYPASLSDSENCQILFVGSAKSRDLPAITDYATKHQMLTISEIPGFVEGGGVIGYVKEGNVIRFEINLKAAQSAGLHVNSRLLELAVRVIR